MSWEMEYHEAENFVRVAASGSVLTEDALAQVTAGVGLIRERGAGGALVDYSKAILEMPIVDIYKLPDLFDALELPRSTWIAIVLRPTPRTCTSTPSSTMRRITGDTW